MIHFVEGVLEKHGGVQGLVDQFKQQGLGATINSWVGSGQNDPITPEQVHQAVGLDLMKELAAKAGMSPDDLAKKLATVLPTAVDKLTPAGKA